MSTLFIKTLTLWCAFVGGRRLWLTRQLEDHCALHARTTKSRLVGAQHHQPVGVAEAQRGVAEAQRGVAAPLGNDGNLGTGSS